MKNKVLAGLIISIAILGYFYLNRQTVEKEDNSIGAWVLVKVIGNGKFIAEYKYKNLVKLSTLGQNGSIKDVYYYEYDAKGREISNAIDIGNNGVIDENSSRVFNEEDRIIEEREKNFEGTGESRSLEYHYNEKGQLLKIVMEMANGQLHLVEKYTYKDGKVVLVEHFGDREELLSQEEYAYVDNRLKEIRTLLSSKDRKLELLSKYYYNKDGLLEKTVVRNNNVTKFSYDDENRLVLEERDSRKDTYIYNDDSKLMASIYYEKDKNGEFKEQSKRLYYDNGKTEIVSDNSIVSIYKDITSSQIVTSKERRNIYDEHGNLIEIWDDADGKLIEKRFYQFEIPNN